MPKLTKLVEEIILVILILMNILELFGKLPGDVSFIKSIVSVTAIGYVLVKASLTDLFFGERNHTIDLFLVFSYFLLIVNKFVQFAINSVHESHLLQEFFILIIDNAIIIEKFAYYAGTISLLLITLYAVIKVNFNPPSILKAIHGDKSVNKFSKFITIFFVVLGFYIIFFNLVMEWLTLVLDAPLIVLVLFIYIFKVHNIGKRMENEEILFKVSEFLESFVKAFIDLFHSKHTIFLGITGLLVLHLVSDVGAFIIPYSFGTHSLYSEGVHENHLSLSTLYNEDKLVEPDLFTRLLLFIGYIMNTIGLSFLMIFPTFIWYVLYVSKINESSEAMKFPGIMMSFFYSCLVYLIFLPVFKTTSSSIVNLYGVDIQTQSILSLGNSVLVYSGIALGVFLFVLILSNFDSLKSLLFFLMSILSLGDFGFYIYNYFSSVLFFYVDFISVLFAQNTIASLFLAGYNVIFLTILLIFYLGGYLSFIISVFKSE